MRLLELEGFDISHLAAYWNIADARLFDPRRLKELIRVKPYLVI